MLMLDKIFGKVENDELVELALTHPSFTKENNLEPLLSFERYPDYPEGDLSKIRSILVSDAILAKIAFEIGLDKLIKLGPSEEKQGGRHRESNLACSLEALLGAYYLNNKIKEIEELYRR